MTQVIPFSSDVFASMSSLQRFLEGRDAVREIAICRKKSSASLLRSERLNGQNIEWISTPELFLKIYAVFVRQTGCLLVLFGMQETGSRLVLYARRITLCDDRYYRDLFGKRFLVRSINLPKPDKADVFAHPPIACSSLLDTQVRKLVHPNRRELSFENGNGVCLGSSDWFAYLYFKTRQLFSDPRHHLIAIARLFKEGAPIEAQVLQKFQNLVVKDSPHLGLTSRIVTEISTQGKDVEKITNVALAFVKAAPGFYALTTPHHRMNWIKVDDSTSYLFDPNIGLVESSTADDYIDLAAKLVGTYEREDDPFLFRLKIISQKIFANAAAAA